MHEQPSKPSPLTAPHRGVLHRPEHNTTTTSHSTQPTELPAPCTQCGASMQSRGASGLVASAQLVCAFCGHGEPLPSEPFARNHYLKERLRQMQRGREAAEVPLRKMLSLKKSMPLLALLMLSSTLEAFFDLPATLELLREPGALELSAVVLLMAQIGLTVGTLVGWAVLSSSYRRVIRPLLLAAPAATLGAPPRCRSCGGAMPASSAAHVDCEFCHAVNVLHRGALQPVGDDPQRREATHRQRVAAWGHRAEVFARPARLAGAAALLAGFMVCLGGSSLVWMLAP